jgi:citrate lyase subunit beta / citryl-CoA lyase
VDRRDAPQLRRSVLVVPGSNARMVDKASALGADQVVFDLEDAVPPAAKGEARELVTAALREQSWGATVRSVRINDATSRWLLRDVTTVVGGALEHLDTLVLPKVASPGQVAFVDHLLMQLELERGTTVGRIGLELQFETAGGLLAAQAIIAASDRIRSVTYGPGDLAAALGMPDTPVGAPQPGYPGDHWHHVAMTLLLSARAAGIQVVDGPYARVRDLDGFRERALRARALGYDGTWVLHPGQVAPANEIFGVTQVAFERAADLLDAYEHAVRTQGRGAVMFGPEMIDEATTKLAAVVLAKGRAEGRSARAVPEGVAFEDRAAWRRDHA